MTAEELFNRLGPLVSPMLEAGFHRRDLCVLATRIVMDVGEYYGLHVEPVPVQLVAYNAAFASHVENHFLDVDVSHWKPIDGSHSVGAGFGLKNGKATPHGYWNGHLIAVCDGWFGDYAISQVERPQHGIHTGPAIVAPYRGAAMWQLSQDGTTIEYNRIEDDGFRNGPDWRDKNRRRRLVGPLIRTLNGRFAWTA